MIKQPERSAKANPGVDIYFFVPPPASRFWHPEIGPAQLIAYLKGKGFTAGQKDLNALFREHCRARNPAGAVSKRRFDIPLFWQPPPRRGAALWNPGTPGYDIKKVLAAIKKPNPLYDDFFEAEGLPPARAARVVGFSLNTADQLVAALHFARRLRAALPEKKICLGGPWVSASWAGLVNWPELFDLVDFMVGFSGEVPLARLLAGPLTEKALAGVPNTASRVGKKVRLGPLIAPLPLEKTPLPDFDGLDLGLYPEQVLPYQTTRGCEWSKCGFCCHSDSWNKFRSKPVSKVMAELKALHVRYGVTAFNLANISTPMPVMKSLAAAIRREKLPFTWHSLVRAQDGLDQAAARELWAGGCRGMRFGLETSDQGELDRLGKGISLETFHKNLLACGAAGIEAGVFLLSYPGQTLKGFKASLAYCFKNSKLITALIPERFKMGRSMAQPEAFKGKLAQGAAADLDSFDLPYQAAGLSQEEFGELRAHAGRVIPYRLTTPA